MKVLITGGAGFIGRHLCEFLLEKGFEVICVDNFLTSSPDNISHLKSNPKFTLIEHNITKPIEIEGNLDYVLHLASAASPVDYLKMPIQTLKVGSAGTHNALGLAMKKKAVFMLTSTSEVYGDPLVHPQPESYWGNVNPIGPRGVYDEAKRFAEAVTMAYHTYHKMDTKIARIFNTYGPHMRDDDGRVVPNFISQALKNEPLTVYGDGTQTRSLCFISDMIEGLYALMRSKVNQPINIGNPQEITVLDFAKKVIELCRSKSEISFKHLPIDDPKTRRPDILLAKQHLHWEPKVTLDAGLAQTIKWFKEHRSEE